MPHFKNTLSVGIQRCKVPCIAYHATPEEKQTNKKQNKSHLAKNKLKQHTFQHNERIPDPSGIPVDKCLHMKL